MAYRKPASCASAARLIATRLNRMKSDSRSMDSAGLGSKISTALPRHSARPMAGSVVFEIHSSSQGPLLVGRFTGGRCNYRSDGPQQQTALIISLSTKILRGRLVQTPRRVRVDGHVLIPGYDRLYHRWCEERGTERARAHWIAAAKSQTCVVHAHRPVAQLTPRPLESVRKGAKRRRQNAEW